MYKKWPSLSGRIVLSSLVFFLYFLVFYNKHISFLIITLKKKKKQCSECVRQDSLMCVLFNFRILPQTHSPGTARSRGSSWEECDPALPRGFPGHEVCPPAGGNPGSLTVPECLGELGWLPPPYCWTGGLWELQLCLLWDHYVKQGIISQQASYDLGDW